MKEYIKDLIPRVKKFSSKLDILTLIINKNWVLLNYNESTKKVYIFERNNRLIISENGFAKIGKWEHLNSGTLLITFQDIRLLFSQGFVDNKRLVLKIDGLDEYLFFKKEENSGIIIIEPAKELYPTICSPPDNLRYQILKETEGWGGKFIEFELLFDQNQRGKIIYDNTKKVYYHNEFKLKKYFEEKEKCIENLKFHLDRKKQS
jgi:hypothetical protein